MMILISFVLSIISVTLFSFVVYDSGKSNGYFQGYEDAMKEYNEMYNK